MKIQTLKVCFLLHKTFHKLKSVVQPYSELELISIV